MTTLSRLHDLSTLNHLNDRPSVFVNTSHDSPKLALALCRIDFR
jgi:hypothetical protein